MPSDVLIDDEDLITSRRNPKFQHDQDDEEELSDYVKGRLLLARLLAMKRYQEKWT